MNILVFFTVVVALSKSAISYTQDSDCFDAFYDSIINGNGNGNGNGNNTNSSTPFDSKLYPDDVQVTVKHLHNSDSQISIKSEKTVVLKRNERTVLTFRYYSGSGFTDYNPRNLTLLFDGSNVYGAIGHLEDQYNGLTGPVYSSKWLDCETYPNSSRSLTFRNYRSIFSTGSTSYSSEDLEITVSPPSTPYGPSYDNDCAVIMGAPTGPTGQKGVVMDVNVKRIYRVSSRGSSFESVKEEFVVEGVGKDPVIVHVNHTTADDDYGFIGAKLNPRNLTLWVDAESNELRVAIARIKQTHSFIVDHQENKETFECPSLDEDDNQLIYCSFSSYSSSSNTFSSQSDLLEVTVVNVDENGSDGNNENGAATAVHSVLILLVAMMTPLACLIFV